MMKKLIGCGLAILFAGILSPGLGQTPARPPSLTILYNNIPFDSACATDWGFSCLIRGFGKTILFDVGAKEDLFLRNAAAVGVDLKAVDVLVLSHFHPDHVGAIAAFLKLNPAVRIYMPDDPSPDPAARLAQERIRKSGASAEAVAAPREIMPGVFLTGTMGASIKEQALVLDTPGGLVIVTGCAHPGITGIVAKAKSIRPREIALLLGGFHLLDSSRTVIKEIIAEFKKSGIRQIGATHCTGDTALAMLRDAYGRDFIESGVGRTVVLR